MSGRPQSIFQRAQGVFAALGSTVYVDLSTMREAHWTGIPVVAAGLCGALLELLPDQVRFFDGYALIGNDFVADAVARNTGVFLDWDIKRGYAQTGTLPVSGEAGPSMGLFASVKPLRRAFDVEASIFHDLSTVTMPLFHIRGNVVHHTNAFQADIASNDFSITVSEATRADLSVYLGTKLEDIVAVPNGVTWPAWFAAMGENAAGPARAEPYFLVLGTREPRKNIMKVFDLLEARPDLLAGHRFVFAGKMGWLEEQHALPRSLEPFVADGRITFTGFVSEAEKYVLLRHATATLYPSLFEGFGLPVLESLSVGTPCVASWSSSIPEVGGEVCSYFDPFSVEDFARAIEDLLARRGPALEAACRARAEKFTWRLAAARILDRALKCKVFQAQPTTNG